MLALVVNVSQALMSIFFVAFNGAGNISLWEHGKGYLTVFIVNLISFSEEPLLDHRNIKLSAVKERYAEGEFLEVSNVTVLDHATLRAQLYVKDEDLAMEGKICSLPSTPTPCGRVEPFLMSPSRSSRSNR